MPQVSFHSPVGDLTLCEEGGLIVAIEWGWGGDQNSTPVLASAVDQLERYFDGEPVHFDVPIDPSGGTPYRKRVWQALRQIPPGETRTYSEVAALVGGSARSVGTANALNPIPILIPCHRVLARGGIGGYSGGDGISTKRYLLAVEARSFGSNSTPLLAVHIRGSSAATGPPTLPKSA